MLFLVPTVALVLLVVFFVLLGVRARRRHRFVRRPPRLHRLAADLGDRTGRRAAHRRPGQASSEAQRDSFRPS